MEDIKKSKLENDNKCAYLSCHVKALLPHDTNGNPRNPRAATFSSLQVHGLAIANGRC